MKNKFILLFLILFLTPVHAQNNSLQRIAQSQGFFFFYSASCPHCQRFAPILREVSQTYGFHVLAISIDGGYLHSFPNAVMDEGQRHAFRVTTLPSLFLVNPKIQQGALVTEGAISREELIQRLLHIITLQEQSNG